MAGAHFNWTVQTDECVRGRDKRSLTRFHKAALSIDSTSCESVRTPLSPLKLLNRTLANHFCVHAALVMLYYNSAVAIFDFIEDLL